MQKAIELRCVGDHLKMPLFFRTSDPLGLVAIPHTRASAMYTGSYSRWFLPGNGSSGNVSFFIHIMVSSRPSHRSIIYQPGRHSSTTWSTRRRTQAHGVCSRNTEQNSRTITRARSHDVIWFTRRRHHHLSSVADCHSPYSCRTRRHSNNGALSSKCPQL